VGYVHDVVEDQRELADAPARLQSIDSPQLNGRATRRQDQHTGSGLVRLYQDPSGRSLKSDARSASRAAHRGRPANIGIAELFETARRS
jgi:hypothetical protein